MLTVFGVGFPGPAENEVFTRMNARHIADDRHDILGLKGLQPGNRIMIFFIIVGDAIQITFKSGRRGGGMLLHGLLSS